VIRISDRESGLSARTIARRLSSVAGFYAYLIARGDTGVTTSPVPRGLSTRRRGGRAGTVPLVRVPRPLPRILDPAEVTALLSALRTHRDRAMVLAMLLGGLRRCEVLGLRLADVRMADRSLFVAEGKGAHERVVPVTNAFFIAVGDYLRDERPATSTDRVFVVSKGPRRPDQGLPQTANHRGTLQDRDHAVSEALRRPRALPTPPSHHHRNRPPATTRQRGRVPPLTSRGASRPGTGPVRRLRPIEASVVREGKRSQAQRLDMAGC
jgi:site-specific recombinase XerD